MIHKLWFLEFLCFGLGLVLNAPACSLCNCSHNTDWAAQGFDITPGITMTARYDYINQTKLWKGTHSVVSQELPNEQELQQRTESHIAWLDLSGAKRDWSVKFALPQVWRYHTTIAEGDTEVSASHTRGIGDARVWLQYAGFREPQFVLQVGLKLPTGSTTQVFDTGPLVGTLVDRGLQRGTGTTDILLDAAWFPRTTGAWGAFAQTSVAQPLSPYHDFLPSSIVTIGGGVHWRNTSGFLPQLQVLVTAETREQGGAADTQNSGGTRAYVCPGVRMELGERMTAFTSLQVPVFRRVNGLQLEPAWLISGGWRLRL